MSRLTFWGATGTVTGSRFVFETDEKKILIDCGLFQGTKENRLKNWEAFPISPAEIAQVFLTHAHIDHTGYLPRFCQDGFKGTVHCTHATNDLVRILLRDSAHLQEEDASWANEKGFSKHEPAKPLYTIMDTELALARVAPLFYGEDFFIGDRTRVKFKDAGHILGSSFIDIKKYQNKTSRKILFSGDFGRAEKLVLHQPVQVYDVDYLVLESTYGNRLHDNVSSIYAELTRIINQSVSRGGVLVIPAFAVGRTQTLLYVIRELEEQGRIPIVPIYMDSPMAISVTDVFNKRISDQDMSTRIQMIQGKEVFEPRELNLCRSREQSKAINGVRNRAIIISASGMATGGRILHHLQQRLPHEENTILFIGYQAEGTRGRTILEGKPTVKIHSQQVPVAARIENISGFSGHGDYNEILAWLMGFNRPPEKTFIVHGEPDAAESMALKIRERFGWVVTVPKYGESFDLEF
jgi:metallo-beta-lactamase family protein